MLICRLQMWFTNYLNTPSARPSHKQSTKKKTRKPDTLLIRTITWNNERPIHTNNTHMKRNMGRCFANCWNYKYLINRYMTATRTTIPITDRSMHMQEQPPLVRLFKTAKCFWTRCFYHSKDHKRIERERERDIKIRLTS